VEALDTVKETAARLKGSPCAVLDWIRAGTLRAATVGKAWRLKESDMEAFFAAGVPREAPPDAAETEVSM
jgi:excisionase family DNA binding protein